MAAPRRVPTYKPPRFRGSEARPSAAARGYDRRWQRGRALYLAEHPECVRCDGLAAVVDHIVPRRDGGADDPSNYQSLCATCHNRKTATEDGGFGRQAARRRGRMGGAEG